MKIHFGERGTEPIPSATQLLLRQVISAGLKHHPQYRNLSCSLAITFVTPAEMRELNATYRGKDTPTDVLSFPNTMPNPIIPGNRRMKPKLNLGSIIICTQVAQSQAVEYNHSLERELAFLTAHGFLHLIGYDHTTDEDERTMIALQKQILKYVGATR